MRRVTREQSLGNAEGQVTIPDEKGGNDDECIKIISHNMGG